MGRPTNEPDPTRPGKPNLIDQTQQMYGPGSDQNFLSEALKDPTQPELN